MANLDFKKGTYGKIGSRTNVEGVRRMSEPWDCDGVELVSVVVDFFDGSSEQLPEIQDNYTLS